MEALLEPDADHLAAPLPRILWIELTSKCPFDCIFCSRALRRGAGEHLELDLFRSLMDGIGSPEIIRLNYSGESIHYPHLIEAIRLAKQTGAQTELVTAFASISPSLIPQIIESGLDRITISLHTMYPAQYRTLYGFGSLEVLRDRIAQFIETRKALGRKTPQIDFAFVAMRRNLSQLPALVHYAEHIGVKDIFVHPVLRRDPIPYVFEEEILAGQTHPEFAAALQREIRAAKNGSKVRVTVSSPDTGAPLQLGPSPEYYPGELPSDGRILTCDQDPWETAHVLANGDVVVCEVQDRTTIGSLRTQSLSEIWTGEAYRTFRRSYLKAEIEACRTCAWKMAYRPGPLSLSINAADGSSPQLLRGWYGADMKRNIWSKRESWAILGNRPEGTLRIRGFLPSGLAEGRNTLEIIANGRALGSICNPTAGSIKFDTTLGPLPAGETLNLKFSTRVSFNPSRAGSNGDARELGFALIAMEVAPRLSSSISASAGKSPQLLRGWYQLDADRNIWSQLESWAILSNVPGGTLRICGVLPHALDGLENTLEVAANGLALGRVCNPTSDYLNFDASFGPLPPGEPLNLKFATRRAYNPSRSDCNGDPRDLGFALIHLEVAP